jgi:DNA-binding transcriptional LysR family regulator
MHNMHEYLATAPFDLYELHLFHLVAKHRSFTKAAGIVGLTQSAITRQIQGMESSLGVALLERTTRNVRVTEAGRFLLAESARLLGDVEHSLQTLREQFAGARKQVRVGVSRSIALAYLPGFFHANLKRLPEIACRLSHQSDQEILSALESNELDLGVICPPARLPRTIRMTRKFDDAFTLIAPVEVATALAVLPKNRRSFQSWIAKQKWLLLEQNSNTGQRLRKWISKQGWRIEPTMELDNFDLIINLVSLGMGVSFVPIRALALYGQKRTFERVQLPERFTRELAVVVRKHRKMPQHLGRFVENVLF